MNQTNLPKEGQRSPDFNVNSTIGEVSLKNLEGKNVVLYFYPKDSTPGCTVEAKEFSDLMSEFEKLNTVIFGISKDSISSHNKFIEKHCLTIPLITDGEGELCQKFDTWKEKSMFGRKYMGVARDTYLIDAKGIIRNIWKKVKPAGHAKQVLEAVKQL